MPIRVDIRELLAFYDEDRNAHSHANAIKTLAGEELGFALLIDYFTRSGAQAQLLDVPCTTGRQTGVRLDGWLRVVRENETVDYQVEVKNWSFHSLGGRQLAVNCTSQELAAFKIQTWCDYWSGSQFCAPELNKVLTEMNRAPDATCAEPLACLWAAMHRDDGNEPLFDVPVATGWCQRVWIFSMSAHLRALAENGEEALDIDLPILSARLAWLRRIFAY